MKPPFPILILLALVACGRQEVKIDASGSFEADEIIVSSEATGRILSLNVVEGSHLAQNSIVGSIDADGIQLQKAQVQASLAALKDKTADVEPQVKMLNAQLAVQQQQLNRLLHEKQRTENLIKSDAATGKQLDDINADITALDRQMEVTRYQIAVQKNNTFTQNRSILSEEQSLQKRVEQFDLQIKDASIINPVNGSVLAKYAEAGEMTSIGKPLYKVANLAEMNLRAYITGGQFSMVQPAQKVKVLVDKGDKAYRMYDGEITWISDKAEFTPKTIQTKEARANLVYAIKVRVKNDRFLKIGMHGDVQFR